jgi:hypothetical protein
MVVLIFNPFVCNGTSGRHVESFRHSVNSDHSTDAKHPAALNGHLRDRTATTHGNCVAGLDFRILPGPYTQ